MIVAQQLYEGIDIKGIGAQDLLLISVQTPQGYQMRHRRNKELYRKKYGKKYLPEGKEDI